MKLSKNYTELKMVRVRNNKLIAYKTPESAAEYKADLKLLRSYGMAKEHFAYLKANHMLMRNWRGRKCSF